MTIAAGSLIEITLNQFFQAQQVLNVFQYEVIIWPGTVSADNAAEGWWNFVKGSYRALAQGAYGSVFKTVRIRELNNPTGDFAEHDLPPADQAGTRAPPTQAEALPIFNAAGVRLVVGTRATRSGQKRFTYLAESDQNASTIQTSFTTPLATLMGILTNRMVLGVPALTVDLQPIVCRKDASGQVTAHQNVTGFLINTYITTQNPRTYGRGA